MGGLTGAVHWWEESQMRVLVLSSLVIQSLLFIFSMLRRFAIPGWSRFVMWLAYLAGDALAIYALATLFNRHKDQGRRDSSTLEVVWAPVLLNHLGGHDGITAYNIEDNELWSRHLFTAVSQVTVAIYVFCKSWPGGDKNLLGAAIVLFVPGVLKCFAKPWALKRASINSLVSSSVPGRIAKENKGKTYTIEEYVKEVKAFIQEQEEGKARQARAASVEDGDDPPSQQGSELNPTQDRQQRRQGEIDALHCDSNQNESKMDPLKEHVEGPRADIPEQMEESERQRERILRREAYKLFVDFSSPYHQRLSILKYFWALSEAKAYASVRQGLAGAFLLLYTRLKTVFVGGSNLVRESKASDTAVLISLLAQALRMWLPWAAIGLFHHSHREVYNDIDVKITYAMFCCTVVLDAYSTLAVSTTERNKEQWPEMVAQYSLVGYVVRKEEHRWMMRIADLFGCKVMRPCFLSHRITQLVLQYLKDGWENQIQDAAMYRSFNDNRGHWTLKVEGYERQLGWSIERPFDESVLLWHIATDFCFFLSPFPDHRCAFAEKYQLLAWFFDVPKPRDTTRAQGTSSTCCQESTACRAVQCRQMSNYMMYLLFVNPEMLLPGTRRNLFTTAYHELKEIRKTSLFITTYKEIKENRPSLSATSGEEIKDTIKGRNRNLVKCKQLRPRKGERLMGRAISTTMLNKSKNASEDESGKSSKEESMEGPKEELTGGSEKKFIDDAWTLAQGLLDLGSRLSEQEMWKVIEGVWVEMLCFSASRCRGYLHAKALGSGGEFLSYIWLLQFYMGIETFTERLQREELIPSPARERLVVLPSWEGNNKVAAPSTSNTNAASSTSNNTTAFPSTSEIQVAGEGMV